MTELGTTIALLSPAEFREFMTLLEYSYSMPTGVSAKRWRAYRQGAHWLCSYYERDGGWWCSRRQVFVLPDGAEIESIKSTDTSPGYWLGRHRDRTVSFTGDLGVVVRVVWEIEGEARETARTAARFERLAA